MGGCCAKRASETEKSDPLPSFVWDEIYQASDTNEIWHTNKQCSGMKDPLPFMVEEWDSLELRTCVVFS